jgi:tetratricopeptide (TPR) repeat protein
MKLLSFFQHRSGKRADILYQSARAMLDEHEYEDALVVARKLRKLHHSGAYEIEGLAYSGLDRTEDAVRVLREGVGEAPGVWLNWHLLANCLSDLGQYDEAMQAYERAEGCVEADHSIIDLNRAVVASRQEAHLSVLAHLNRIESYQDEEARLSATKMRVSALRGLGRVAEAEELGKKTLREWRDANEGDAKEIVGNLAGILCDLTVARGEDREAVRERAIEWWRLTRFDGLLAPIRELRPRRSPAAQYFQLKLNGEVTPGSAFAAEIGGAGYLTAAHVVADSEEEALALYIELNPPAAGVTLMIRQAEILESQPNDLKGVYFAHIGIVIYGEKE